MSQTPSAENDARCICGERHCLRCGVSESTANTGRRCGPQFTGSPTHVFVQQFRVIPPEVFPIAGDQDGSATTSATTPGETAS